MFCHRRFCLSVIIQVLALLMNLGNGQNQSVPHNETGFPFQLVKPKPNSDPCGYISVDPYSSSSSNDVTMVEFPTIPALRGVRLPITYVNYFDYVVILDPENCLPRIFLQLYNSSIRPFLLDPGYPETQTNVTFFDCPAFSCPIYAADPYESILGSDLVSCTMKSQLVSPVSAYYLQGNRLALRWSQPKCGVEKHKPNKIPIMVLPPTGSIVLVLLFIAFLKIYRYFRMKGDDQARLEKFLEDYKALKPTRFSYADLKRITNHFKDKLGEGAHGEVFKGKLSPEILVAVKLLNNSEGDGKEFINEVGTMGNIHHINVVRLLGFCADGFHRGLVYDFFPNGSLQKFISSPDNKNSFLGWLKLQQIALGIARGIEYLHHGCDYRILHFDINPHNVLLDYNFIPKISDFGLAKLYSKNQSTVSITAARGTLGYMAPEVFSKNFGNVSYKSDIYSYGMLLLEMVGGRKNTNTSKETFQVLYPEWIHNLIEGEDINIHIEDEEDIRIAKKLAVVGLWCIQWHPINRPSMKTVIQMLEGEGDKLKVPPTPFDFTVSTNASTIIPTKKLIFELEVIHELE